MPLQGSAIQPVIGLVAIDDVEFSERVNNPPAGGLLTAEKRLVPEPRSLARTVNVRRTDSGVVAFPVPQYFLPVFRTRKLSRDDEQQIREPVQVLQNLDAYGFFPVQ
jgi:hypothetical protein